MAHAAQIAARVAALLLFCASCDGGTSGREFKAEDVPNLQSNSTNASCACVPEFDDEDVPGMMSRALAGSREDRRKLVSTFPKWMPGCFGFVGTECTRQDVMVGKERANIFVLLFEKDIDE